MPAYTDANKVIHIYKKGPAFETTQINPVTGRPIQFSLGKGLNQVQFGAFIVFHEYGHKTGVFGADADDYPRNRQHSLTILNLFFPEARR
jgi:hypothetical protein